MTKSHKLNKRLSTTFLVLANIVLSILLLFPIIYCFTMSFMTNSEIYARKLLPSSFLYFGNFKEALAAAPLFRYMLNSLIVSFASVFLQIITGILAAYAFSMMHFRGRNVLFMIFLATMMIPSQAIIIANYLTVASWGILDTFLVLILPYACTAFSVFNLRQGFLSLPSEIHDAAIVDGCTNFRYLYKIGLPLMRPMIGALAIYQFLHVWNGYLWPLLVTNSDEMRTVQIGLNMLQNAEAAKYGPVMAGAMIVLVPSLIVFLVGENQMVSGLTAGAVKG